MRRTPHELAASPTSHSATYPAEFNAVCPSKPNLPNRTDSIAALLPYLAHQLGSAHEWSGVWNGRFLTAARTAGSAAMPSKRPALVCLSQGGKKPCPDLSAFWQRKRAKSKMRGHSANLWRSSCGLHVLCGDFGLVLCAVSLLRVEESSKGMKILVF